MKAVEYLLMSMHIEEIPAEWQLELRAIKLVGFPFWDRYKSWTWASKLRDGGKKVCIGYSRAVPRGYASGIMRKYREALNMIIKEPASRCSKGLHQAIKVWQGYVLDPDEWVNGCVIFQASG